MTKPAYHLIGKITSKGGYAKEGNYDSLEIRYYHKTIQYSPKISIILQSFSNDAEDGKSYERKSFRFDCEDFADADKILILCEMLSKSYGFVYGNKMRQSLSEMENKDKQIFFSETFNNIIGKKFYQIKESNQENVNTIIENFKQGFKQAVGILKY